MKKFKKIDEAVDNPKVAELISVLRDERFSNEDQRKKFIDIITSLFSVKDADARKFIKQLGDACTLIGDDMLNEPEEVDNMEESIPLKVKSSPKWKGVKVNESMDDNVIEAFISKSKRFKMYVKKNKYPMNRESIISAMFDFAYENHIDLKDEEANYLMDTVFIDEFNI